MSSVFPWTNPGGFNWYSLNTAVPDLFSIAIIIAGLIFVIMFLVGGIQYLSSGGNEESANKSKKLLLDAVIGIIIVAVSWGIGTWIMNTLFNSTGALTVF